MNIHQGHGLQPDTPLGAKFIEKLQYAKRSKHENAGILRLISLTVSQDYSPSFTSRADPITPIPHKKDLPVFGQQQHRTI